MQLVLGELEEVFEHFNSGKLFSLDVFTRRVNIGPSLIQQQTQTNAPSTIIPELCSVGIR